MSSVASRSGAPLSRLSLPIEGMTCASCVGRVERALTAVPGVMSASVNLATERADLGFIGAAGLLRSEDCTAVNEETAWKYYRTPPNERLPGVYAALTPYVHHRDTFRISKVGTIAGCRVEDGKITREAKLTTTCGRGFRNKSGS